MKGFKSFLMQGELVVIAVGLARGRSSTMRSGQMYAPVILLGGIVAVAAMEHALIVHDFSLTYVADNNSGTAAPHDTQPKQTYQKPIKHFDR